VLCALLAKLPQHCPTGLRDSRGRGMSSAAIMQVATIAGCSVDVARAALARSVDVDDAVLILLQDAAASPSPTRRQPEAPPSAAEDEGESSSTGDEDGSTRSSEEDENYADMQSSEDGGGDDDGDEEEEDHSAIGWPGRMVGGGNWAAMPPDILSVLGTWLAQHLGKLVERQSRDRRPEYLHPLRSQLLDAEDLSCGRRRTLATLEMLRSIRACRQTCRIWRDEISYSGVTQLALDGVACAGAVLPRSLLRRDGGGGGGGGGSGGRPAAEGLASSASASPLPAAAAAGDIAEGGGGTGRQRQRQCSKRMNTLGQRMLCTWWRGHRVIPRHRVQSMDPHGTPLLQPMKRCPACRFPVPNQPEHRALYHYMLGAGLGKWYMDVTEGLNIRSIDVLRQVSQVRASAERRYPLLALSYDLAAVDHSFLVA
jgi:hypothetical protein